MRPRPVHPLDESMCKEQTSLAHVQLLASVAGLAVEQRRVDRHGVDLEILDGPVRVDVQMKGMREVEASPTFSYDLDVPTYNKLADTHRSVPGYLVVVEMPPDQDAWADATASGLASRTRGFYTQITGMPQSSNSWSQVVHMDRDRLVTPESLVRILLDARGGVR